MAKIFHVKVIGKGGDEGAYDVQAKDDAVARVKAIKLWVAAFNCMVKSAREQDEIDGTDISRGDSEYSEKDVSYCEVSLLAETDA